MPPIPMPSHLEMYADAVGDARDAREVQELFVRHIEEPHRPWGGIPAGLAASLWYARDILGKAHNIAHIGTGHGFVFFALYEFAKSLSPRVSAVTIDSSNRVITDVLPHVRAHRHIVESSACLADRTFDAVFIHAGNRALEDVWADYANVGARARVCVLMDVGRDVEGEDTDEGEGIRRYESCIVVETRA